MCFCAVPKVPTRNLAGGSRRLDWSGDDTGSCLKERFACRTSLAVAVPPILEPELFYALFIRLLSSTSRPRFQVQTSGMLSALLPLIRPKASRSFQIRA